MYARRLQRLAVVFAVFLIAAVPASSEPLSLILPTSNDALFRGEEPSFYQFTERYFDGVRSRPWQGGQYGFVRNPKHSPGGLVYTRFHEGVDIRAVHRDRYGEPLDTVRAVDDGYVVYVNNTERRSSYGKYVVVEHWWSGSPFYSLYAHLKKTSVRQGDRVWQGDELGRLGYTGRGIDRERAHLHFEINMLLNRNFQRWYDRHYRSRNWHDVFNGINMAGIDVAALYLSLQEDPELTVKEFLAREEPFYTVVLEREEAPDLIDRYEWLVDWTRIRLTGGTPKSWEISFTASGVPIRIEPLARSVDEPEVMMMRSVAGSYDDLTDGRVNGRNSRYYLSRSGRRYAELFATTGPRREIVDFERPQIRAVSDDDVRLRTW